MQINADNEEEKFSQLMTITAKGGKEGRGPQKFGLNILSTGKNIGCLKTRRKKIYLHGCSLQIKQHVYY